MNEMFYEPQAFASGGCGTITLGSPAYRQLARRHAQLFAAYMAHGLNADDAAEYAQVSKAMDKAEARHGIADVVDDYALIMAAGDLGGVEGL